MHETFWTLIHDRAHWEFEIFLQVLDGVIFGLLWNFFWNKYLKQHWHHHLDRDNREAGIQSSCIHPYAHSCGGNLWKCETCHEFLILVRKNEMEAEWKVVNDKR